MVIPVKKSIKGWLPRLSEISKARSPMVAFTVRLENPGVLRTTGLISGGHVSLGGTAITILKLSTIVITRTNNMEAYFKLINCECGYEWFIIQENHRAIVTCDRCGIMHDVWVDEFLMDGTLEEIVAYLEDE